MPGPKKLPPYHELRRLYRTYTYREIGERYGTTSASVSMALRRGALAAGDPWPMPTVERARRERIRRENRTRGQPAAPLAGLLRDYLAEQQIAAWAFLGQHPHLNVSTIYYLLRGHVGRVSDQVAYQVLRAIGEDVHPSIRGKRYQCHACNMAVYQARLNRAA